MAVNPIQFLVAQNASITDGTKTISISGNVDCSRVYSGTAVFLGGADNPAEAVSGTSPDGSGVSTITLRNNWSQGDIVNQQLVSFNTNEGLAEAISNVREIVSNVSAIEDLATQGLIKRINDNEYEVVNISAVGEALITANDTASQRSVLGLGSAATKNVINSATDTTSGSLLQANASVGYFGLGGNNGATWGDYDDFDIPNGFYSTSSNSVGTFPDNADKAGMLLVFKRFGGDIGQITQLYVNDNKRHLFYRSAFGGVWQPWAKLYDSVNSVNPLDYGLGTFNPPTYTNLNTNQNGVYVNTSQTSTAFLMSRAASRTIKLEAKTTGSSDSQITVQHYDGTTGTEFYNVNLYHSGNTNFNEFGGNGSGQRIAKGTCRGTTSAFIELPLNSTTPVTSVSVTGTFQLTDHTGTNVLVSNIPANAFSLTNTRGSNKFFSLLINVAGGLTGKEPVYLETASADAKIVPLF